MNEYALMPSVWPMYAINSDLGASLFTRRPSGMCTYAAHPNTRRCEMSGTVPCSAWYGVHHLRRRTEVRLYTCTACSTANSHQDSGRQVSRRIACALSMQVHM